MASGPITSWQIDWETVKIVAAGASRQSQSGPENVHGGAEKGN